MSAPWRQFDRRQGLPLAGFLALVALPILSGNLYLQNMLILTFVLAVGASGWNIIGGYAGYISLGNSAFIGLGGYTTAILAVHLRLNPFLGCLAGGVVAGLAAAALSLVTRRTRGMYFVIVTFAALLLLGLAARNWSAVTGGSQGLAMPLPTWDVAIQDWPFYYSLLAVLGVTVAVSAKVRRSKLGLGLFAIQDDEAKAAGLGISTASYKLMAFVLGSMFIGVAGGIYAYYVSFLDPSAMFDIVQSVLMVLAVLLGGRGTVWGPVLGAFVIEPLSELTTTDLGGSQAGAYRLILFAGLLIVVVLFLPRGIIPTVSDAIGRRRGVGPGELAAAAPGQGQPGASPMLGRRRTPPAVGGLTVSGLSKRFGGIRAVDGVDLTADDRSVTGLIGPNGSGKTTLFNLIDGTVRPQSGRVALAGRPIERMSRAQRAHAGLARTYQLPRLFPSLTVAENLVLPERRLSLRRLFAPRAGTAESRQARAVLEHLGLADFADVSPAGLSYGQRKLVELAQVLHLEPVLVLLDEPAAGISPALATRLSAMIAELKDDGVGVLLVEHDLAFMGALSDRVYVMAGGAVIANGSIAEVSADAGVIDAYLGEPGPPVGTEANR